MSLDIQKIHTGFSNITVDKHYKEIALKNIEKWLTDKAFDGYREQLLYLI
jgi:hypothetical protein